MWVRFKTCLPGKWVLVGEHTVMRGGMAIVFPYPEVRFCLDFVPRKCNSLTVIPPDAEPVIFKLLKIYESQQKVNNRFSWPAGRLTIHSTIPQGAGLGSSAALCLGVARWIASTTGIPECDLAETARSLESCFHGNSSGMDIAAVSANAPIIFEKGCPPRALKFERLPHFTLHDTGLRSSTAGCISQVKAFIEKDPLGALSIDRAMDAASYKALKGLLTYCRGKDRAGLELLADGMRMALECFNPSAWNLILESEQQLICSLLADGALAAKPTGSGRGGVVVALWECPQSEPETHDIGTLKLTRVNNAYRE
jgi:mevalonate kinase